MPPQKCRLILFWPYFCTFVGKQRLIIMISFLNLFATAHLMLSVCLTASAATNVYATNDDISKCLDLQAIGAAFAQSSTVQDFENLLNDSSLMLSNLDLNQDGYVDYLRVVETVEGNTHVFVIEAVLGPDVYQEVATVVADVDSNCSNYNVRIIGSSGCGRPCPHIAAVRG